MQNSNAQEERMSSQEDNCLPTQAIAKELGMSAIALNEYLRRKEIQEKKGKAWQLIPPFDGKGLTEIRSFQYDDSHIYDQMVWTERGRAFIFNIVQNGMTPMDALDHAIERPEPMPSKQLSIFD